MILPWARSREGSAGRESVGSTILDRVIESRDSAVIVRPGRLTGPQRTSFARTMQPFKTATLTSTPRPPLGTSRKGEFRWITSRTCGLAGAFDHDLGGRHMCDCLVVRAAVSHEAGLRAGGDAVAHFHCMKIFHLDRVGCWYWCRPPVHSVVSPLRAMLNRELPSSIVQNSGSWRAEMSWSSSWPVSAPTWALPLSQNCSQRRGGANSQARRSRARSSCRPRSAVVELNLTLSS